MTLVFYLVLTAILVYLIKRVQTKPGEKAAKVEPVVMQLDELTLKTQYALDALLYRAAGDRKLAELTVWYEADAEAEEGFTLEQYEAGFRGGRGELEPPVEAQEPLADLYRLLREEHKEWDRALLRVTVGARSTKAAVTFACN